MAYNWNDGRLATMYSGDTFTCTGLKKGQLYALVFYNSTQAQQSVDVEVTWSNSQAPKTVTVPGVTGNKGYAALAFVSGDDTDTISASVDKVQGGQVTGYIASVSMPIRTTGFNNIELCPNGSWYTFQKNCRFYSVPASHWHKVSIASSKSQFICFQMKEASAEVYVVNKTSAPETVIYPIGPSSAKMYTTTAIDAQSISWKMQGNGRQMVFFNADSVQDSDNARICLQSLSALNEAFNNASPELPELPEAE